MCKENCKGIPNLILIYHESPSNLQLLPGVSEEPLGYN